jgi:glycosyltransferase involved in cell wall biosynthesis
MQYIPMLEKAGVEVEVAPFFDDAYLSRLYVGSSTRASVAMAFVRRIKRLRSVAGTDVIWLEKEALPWLPWAIESPLLERGVPIVSDYDDAIFHRYDLHRRPIVRRILGTKIDKVMAASSLVIAGNSYLAERAEHAGAPQTIVIPTVVDMERYEPVAPKVPQARPIVGWIGTPGTWVSYIEPMLPALLQTLEEHDAEMLAVGVHKYRDQPRLESASWSELTEVDLIRKMDIGIMPLDDTPWSRGKCGYKLIQYMACGLPVVASPVGVNRTIVQHGVNGFLASTPAEWNGALTTLLCNPELRARMGDAGRRRVRAEFALDVYATALADALKNAAQTGAGRG